MSNPNAQILNRMINLIKGFGFDMTDAESDVFKLAVEFETKYMFISWNTEEECYQVGTFYKYGNFCGNARDCDDLLDAVTYLANATSAKGSMIASMNEDGLEIDSETSDYFKLAIDFESKYVYIFWNTEDECYQVGGWIKSDLKFETPRDCDDLLDAILYIRDQF